MRIAAVLVMMAVLSLAAGCGASAPTRTPTPQPTATPAWVLATKAEHLVGIWFNSALPHSKGRGLYYRFEADGTICYGLTLEDLQKNPQSEGRFWFEEGIYYEESRECLPIASYWAELSIEEGRAVGLRFEEIDDSDPLCRQRNSEKRVRYVRVD